MNLLPENLYIGVIAALAFVVILLSVLLRDARTAIAVAKRVGTVSQDCLAETERVRLTFEDITDEDAAYIQHLLDQGQTQPGEEVRYLTKDTHAQLLGIVADRYEEDMS